MASGARQRTASGGVPANVLRWALWVSWLYPWLLIAVANLSWMLTWLMLSGRPPSIDRLSPSLAFWMRAFATAWVGLAFAAPALLIDGVVASVLLGMKRERRRETLAPLLAITAFTWTAACVFVRCKLGAIGWIID